MSCHVEREEERTARDSGSPCSCAVLAEMADGRVCFEARISNDEVGIIVSGQMVGESDSDCYTVSYLDRHVCFYQGTCSFTFIILSHFILIFSACSFS